MGANLIVVEFAERTIYFMGDIYSSYDQFQLLLQNKDLTSMMTLLGLVRMCTLTQGVANPIACMMNDMNKLLRDFIPKKTIIFLYNIVIKGCTKEGVLMICCQSHS